MNPGPRSRSDPSGQIRSPRTDAIPQDRSDPSGQIRSLRTDPIPPVPTHWGRGGGSGPGLRSGPRAGGAVRGFRRSLAAPSSHMAEAPAPRQGTALAAAGGRRERKADASSSPSSLSSSSCPGRAAGAGTLRPQSRPHGAGRRCSEGTLRETRLHPSAAGGLARL